MRGVVTDFICSKDRHLYRNAEQVNFKGHRQGLPGGIVMVRNVYGQVVTKIVITATHRNGHFGNQAQGKSDLMTLLVQIRKETNATRTMQHHARQNQHYHPFPKHAAKIAAEVRQSNPRHKGLFTNKLDITSVAGASFSTKR
jgi:hypothetical protein